MFNTAPPPMSLMMPESVRTVPLTSMVPPELVTEKLLVKVRSVTPLDWNVPPFISTRPEPTESALLTCTVPAEINVPPP